MHWALSDFKQSTLSIVQLAKAYVEAQRIPGTQLTYKSLFWAAPPYAMEKETPVNLAVAKVGALSLMPLRAGSLPAL